MSENLSDNDFVFDLLAGDTTIFLFVPRIKKRAFFTRKLIEPGEKIEINKISQAIINAIRDESLRIV